MQDFRLPGRRWLAGGLVAAVLAAGGILLLSRLGARSRIMTNEIIDRSALLEHRFAGVCMNCHRIREAGPVAVNAQTMNFLGLMREEKMLVMAGQRVDVPTALDRLQSPALTRNDLLPHNFVGVCSNCHPVLDIGPSPEFMERAMEMARQDLMSLPFADSEEIARGTSPELSEQNEDLRDFWGYAAVVFLVVCSIYVGMRMLGRANKQVFVKMFDLKLWFKVHAWSSIGFCLAVFLHWNYSVQGNTLLTLSLVIVGWLTIAGFLLRHRLVKGTVRKNVALLHSQQLIFFILLLLVVVGHMMAEEMD